MNSTVIIGCGPAGISCALYLKRAGLDPVIVSKGSGTLAKVKSIDNYYGFESISGKELELRGVRQALALGIEIIRDEVTGISFADSGYTVSTPTRTFSPRAVVIACGSEHIKPKLDKFDTLIGSGTSYCAVCDGFFFRGKPVGVLGAGKYAAEEAKYLSSICEKVFLFTDGKPLESEITGNIEVIAEKTASLKTTDGLLTGVVLQNGDELPLNGLFSAVGTAGAFSFAKKLGLKLDGTDLKVDSEMSCGVPGLYAAGDCTGAPRQIAKAVYQGMTAANSIIAFLNRPV